VGREGPGTCSSQSLAGLLPVIAAGLRLHADSLLLTPCQPVPTQAPHLPCPSLPARRTTSPSLSSMASTRCSTHTTGEALCMRMCSTSPARAYQPLGMPALLLCCSGTVHAGAVQPCTARGACCMPSTLAPYQRLVVPLTVCGAERFRPMLARCSSTTASTSAWAPSEPGWLGCPAR